jgi:hypothetical protein
LEAKAGAPAQTGPNKEAAVAQQSTPGGAAPARPEATPVGGGVVSVVAARRLVLLLLAFWTAIWGISLVFATEAASLGAGIEDDAAQRLLGIHVLILAPLYALLGWNPTKYRVFLWVPYVSQAGITVVTIFDVLADNRDLGESVLPLVVAIIFLALLVFLWQAARKPTAVIRAGGAGAEGGAPASPSAKPEG